MDWSNFIKRYAWDENRTPYLIRVPKLSKFQAKKELFVYTLFLAILFAMATLVLVAGAKSGVNFKSLAMAFYTFSVFCSAVVLGMNKFHSAALYAASAPVAAFLYVLVDELGPELSALEKIGLLIISLAWLRYALRIVAISKHFPRMPDDGTRSEC